MKPFRKTAKTERGMVLISSMLLLIVVTIIALSMFRSFGIQEKIAGNTREKQRALSAAISAQQFAENWLMNNATQAPVDCVAGFLNGNTGFGQICSLATSFLTMNTDVTTVPWTIGGQPVGVQFQPAGMLFLQDQALSVSAGANPPYYDKPAFYIADMGPSADATIPGEIFQIDAYGYGSSAGTVAVVESTYAVYTTSSSPTI